MSPEYRNKLSEISNIYTFKKSNILTEHKNKVRQRQEIYKNNCKEMKEYEAWRISYKMDKDISEWFYSETEKLNQEYDNAIKSLN